MSAFLRPAPLLALVLSLSIALLSDARAEPVFPALSGRVVDEAALIPSADRDRLTQSLADLETKSSAQLVVVTLRSLQGYEIEEFGYKLGRHWGIGQKGKDNGVLLIVAPNERSVGIEVGRGLEATLTDAQSKAIIERVILPRFRRGDMAAGITAGAEAIAGVILGDPEAVTPMTAVEQESGIDWGMIALVVLWFGVIAFLHWRSERAAREAGGRRRRRRKKIEEASTSSSWSRDSDSSSSSSGSGWSSGGGGSFGGGGASGRW